MKDVLEKVEDLDFDDRSFIRYDFQAVVHHQDLRSKPEPLDEHIGMDPESEKPLPCKGFPVVAGGI
jgi:hypothetical protein